ncbi:phage tail assembly protein [Hyphomicrobium sp. NDB2Meth4]|uniref:phage tail assembly protein n=1 Tax=Hyphomicrobium sp. NDB2Meth4 TaxID=1892846 RepID=UPI000A8449B0|nr:phage tail assembly protein [Hyphomicrobium sp. NDB2Meth4]
MTTKPAMNGLTKDFHLQVPITDEVGSAWTKITLREPTLADMIAVERKVTALGNAFTADMLSLLSNLPETAVRKLKFRDLRPIERWLNSLQHTVADDDPLEAVPQRTFKLLVPLQTNGAPITSLTVREPDLDCGIMVDKFKGAAEQQAAMIAALSDQVIPVITRMAMRDVRRIDAWLNFFSFAGAFSPETGEGMSANPSSADGVTSPQFSQAS